MADIVGGTAERFDVFPRLNLLYFQDSIYLGISLFARNALLSVD
ncbi:MAG: hypothetical protein CM15mP51_00460 [Porticoccaceae bacterium]|nr:MAG: hypothetical protein CM15mP51_00460 [Porticoccaceae bacterium]